MQVFGIKTYDSEGISLKQLTIALMGLSWLALVISPWAIITFIIHFSGLVPLSSATLIITTGILFTALPQLIATLHTHDQGIEKHRF